MSNSKKILDFEIIDFETILKANKTIDVQELGDNHFCNIIYNSTPNGLLIVYSEEVASKQNITLLKLFNESVYAFFKKHYYINAQESIDAAFNYTTKKLYYNSNQNLRLAGRKINSLIVLIRDKKIYFGSVGSANLFIKTLNGIERLTPKNEDFENYQFTEIKALKTSDLEQNLKVNIDNSPFFSYKGDILLITSTEYTKYNDENILNIIKEETDIEKSAKRFLQLYSEKQDFEKPNFMLVKLDFKGGNYSNRGTFGFYYENFFQLILNAITSVPALIIMAALVITLFVFAIKHNLIF